MHTCPFCGAHVPDLANHYGGHQVEPCPDVLYAFGPAEPRIHGAAPALAPDSYVHGRDARRPCVVRGCMEPPYRRGRCLEHFREIVKRQKDRDRAKAAAREQALGRVAA